MATPQWEQGETLEFEIGDLSSTGDGVGRWENRVIFVPDTVPGDRVQARLVHVKPTFARGKLLEVVEPSRDRIRPACIVADKCGGCQWQPLDYVAQLAAKQRQVIDALQRVGGFSDAVVKPILGAPDPLGYRNKATYPLALSETGTVKAGYYRKGSHQVVNLNQCPVQDDRLNPLLAEIKQDIQAQGWKIYDETTHQGLVRHLALRIGRRTGEMLLTLVSTRWELPNIEEMADLWKERYPRLVGVCVNLNPNRTNAIFGAETRYVAGRPYLEEEFAGLRFHIQPSTFFQVHTEQAERLLHHILQTLALTGTENVVDAYCGIGTLTLPLARQSKHCLGLEVQAESVDLARENARLNGIRNVHFRVGGVGKVLPAIALETPDRHPDVVVLDPPRKGCDAAVIEGLRTLHPGRIAYMSCNPATLARDLKLLCAEGHYQLQHVQPADFFPQTAHVECVAFLAK